MMIIFFHVLVDSRMEQNQAKDYYYKLIHQYFRIGR